LISLRSLNLETFDLTGDKAIAMLTG